MWHVCDIEEVHSGLWWGNLKKRDYLEDQGVAGKTMLKWIFKKNDRGVDWIHMAQDTHK
jgi:hypothetical protein